MSNKPPIHLFWFRRDLRLEDNTGLFNALQSGNPVLPIFIFDTHILDKLANKKDPRVTFIHQSVGEINHQLANWGSGIRVFHGKPIEVFKTLCAEYKIDSVFTNHDYEAYAIERDREISSFLTSQGISFHTFKDQVIYEKAEVVKDDGKPYTVFTPYSRKWKQRWISNPVQVNDISKLHSQFFPQRFEMPSLESIGFQQGSIPIPSSTIDPSLIQSYAQLRDIPGVGGTSKLGIHLRFGTISIRQLACQASTLSEVFLNELIWRDFYHMILWHFPHINQNKSFKPAYDQIEWRHDEPQFKKWCEGKTGYPIVDAGMRELNTTGFMHNRVRMIVASFLCKHLLIDWRWGEAYFAEKLLDFDFAANNGGWQWAAGSGCDAAPYFRIFNPYLQTKKFDPDFKYIKKWVPEFQEFDYPSPIVDHEFARKRCLEIYKKGLRS